MTELSNGDLRTDIEKHQSADEVDISIDEYNNTEEFTWVIDVNDDGYFYYNKVDRDNDYEILKDLFPDFIDMGMM